MTKENKLDGPDWCKVVNHKNAPFLLKPDKTDNVVYTDEYLNYLNDIIGKSDSATGFKAYALDNEPALWQHISGAIAQADFLGLLAEKEIYFASIWAFDKAEYQFAAINMFTNYDENQGYFGDNLVSSNSSDDYTVSSFVAENSTDGKLHIILTNKAIHTATKVTINLGDFESSSAELYVLDKSGPTIYQSDSKIKTKIISYA